ncbi:AhpD-like protein [Phialemonium atrogriseum]|uniref:AhpD-like protein n=1 Tax=Phialemonium atrogriseum TaxID=1093897 RepID=A0AAJ0C8I0_9PEZI|nr:AhpD-like protein [Phialemonium atrogriseum]KAK1770677.1 AhpD-like protein [Phialemonium atrogriseum]
MIALPAAIITPSLLSSIRRHPNLPKNTWYFIAATTLSILNRPDEIHKVYKHAIDNGPGHIDIAASPDEQLGITRRMREALVKAAAIGGLPKTINSLLELKKATPEHLIDEPLGCSPTMRSVDVYDVPSSQILHRGQTYFDKVYGKVSKRVMGQMDRSGTEDLGLTARLMYGYILSNTQVLTPVETSFVLIAALIPQDVNPQLKGHLKGSLNAGATVEEVKAVRNVVMEICEVSGMVMLDKSHPGGWGWRTEVANV